MLNFIALGLASYLLTGPFRGQRRRAPTIVGTAPIPESGWLPGLNGIFDALGLAEPAAAALRLPDHRRRASASAISVLLNRTRFGFDLRASGLSPSAASASGVDARAMVVKTMLLSARSPGWSACPTCWAAPTRTRPTSPPGLGFLGIAVALLGRNKPGRHRARRAAVRLPRPVGRCRCRSASFPASVVTIIQGTIVLAVVVANEIAGRIARRPPSAQRGRASRSARRATAPTRRSPRASGGDRREHGPDDAERARPA